jgi:hypothetical protein
MAMHMFNAITITSSIIIKIIVLIIINISSTIITIV